MAPVRRKKEGLLARVNFPLYTLQMLTSRHVLVAGGGGSSKTGVANGFEIFELAHDGKRFVAEEVIRHETGPTVVMNCAAHSCGKHTYLVAGQESHCQLYKINMKIVDAEEEGDTATKDKPSEDGDSVRQRVKPKDKEDKNNTEETASKIDRNRNSYHRLKLEIKPLDSIQTDFSKDEPFQRVVRVSRSGKLMVTGGTDGHVRVWSFPAMASICNIAAHSREVDDIDISPDGKKIISISKDGVASIWESKSGKKILDLKWKPPDGLKYAYKRCRFGIIENDLKNCSIYTITNPVVRSKNPSFLQSWNPSDGTGKKYVSLDESLSALAVSDDGRFVSIGTMFSGSVDIYISFSLQRILHVQGAHSMFITGLEFLPVMTDDPPITSSTDAAVLSISVDNQVCIHSVAARSTLPVWFVIILIVISLFFTFVMCSYLGL